MHKRNETGFWIWRVGSIKKSITQKWLFIVLSLILFPNKTGGDGKVFIVSPLRTSVHVMISSKEIILGKCTDQLLNYVWTGPDGLIRIVN